ncbi:MAG: glycoside hydrolase family 3 C-terminal domain-containing protein, partial [Mobilitalea sp.]
LEAEGATLLYNKDNTLPLNESKVTILGASSHNYVQGGTGSAGGRDDSNTAMMDKAFSNAGIDYNKTAWTWLDNALGNGANIHNGSVNAEYLAAGDPAVEYNWTSYQQIHEFSIATYEQFVTPEVIGDYGDVAIVTFARSGAEGASPSLDYDGNKDTTTGRTYLELDDNEIALLKFCKENFKSTVVLVNSAVPIETGFVNNADYNVGAVLWIGHPGEAGMYGVANILSGKTNPSGHVVDTWGYDMSTNPTYYSANDQTYSNITMQSKNKYYEYNEGIYVGYRYYETADAAGYFDSETFQSTKFKGNLSEGKYFADLDVNGTYEAQKAAGPQATYSGYEEVVQFPFGYGLSYTSFTQKIKKEDIKLEEHGQNSITVTVENTGSVAGKSVVQLYMQAPYNQDSDLGIDGVGLEKAQVILIGFDKTEVLEPGDKQDITIEFSTDDLATFDQFGQGCYVLEKGDYTFHVSPNAHGWANEEAYGMNYDSAAVSLASSIIYSEDGAGARVGTMNGVTATEDIVAVNAMNDITVGDGSMLVNGGASGTYTYGYLSRKDFGAGMTEIMTYQSDDLTGVYSGNGYVWSTDGKGTTAVVTGDAAGQRKAGAAVKEAIETTPKSLENSSGVSSGKEYNYQSILAEGITFGDGSTSKLLYGYGNDAYINQEYTRDSLLSSDESYLKAESGVTIAWNEIYYVALDTEGVTVKDTDGYVKIYDTEADANAEGSATKLQVDHMAGVLSDDYTRWDKLTNMLSFKEADDLMGENGWHTYGADSVGKKFALAVDGPGEAGNAQNADCTWWPCAVIIAATWNTDLATEQGVAYGHQDLLNNTPYCYAPAMNTHRTPFGGRDFEYYSEDGFIAGVIGGHVVQGLQSTGMHVFIKHYALNDSDTNRGGVNTWADEMSIREIYAKPYEISTKYFNADGIMGSLNSMGMAWAHTGFYITMTRDEWGWNGLLITDGDGSASDVYNHFSFWTMASQGGILGSGTLSANTAYATIGTDGAGASNYTVYTLHNIARNALYQYSHNIDKLNAATTFIPNTVLPKIILGAGNGVLLIGILGSLLAVILSGRKNKKVR